jgi:hypothetical protein
MEDDLSPLSPASIILSFDAEAAKQQYEALHGGKEREEQKDLRAQQMMVLGQTLAKTKVSK